MNVSITEPYIYNVVHWNFKLILMISLGWLMVNIADEYSILEVIFDH